MQPGLPVWVSGPLAALEEADLTNQLVMDNCTVFSSDTLPH
jgi:hypothetical protein